MEAILNKLEYNEIIDVLEKHCKTYLGKNMCDSLKPSFSFELVDVLLNETKEADTLLHQKGSPPFYETDELEKYIYTGECDNSVSKERIDRLHVRNIHKLLPMPMYKKSEDEII